MNEKSKSSNTLATDVRTVLFFVFFALTISAGSGLLQGTKSADTRLARTSQFAAPAVSESDDMDREIIHWDTYIAKEKAILEEKKKEPSVCEQVLKIAPSLCEVLPSDLGPTGGDSEANKREIEQYLKSIQNEDKRAVDDAAAEKTHIEVTREDDMSAYHAEAIPGVYSRGKKINDDRVMVSAPNAGLDITYDPKTDEYFIWYPGATDQVGPLSADDERVVEAKRIINEHRNTCDIGGGACPGREDPNKWYGTTLPPQITIDPIKVGKNRCGTTYIKVEADGSQKVRECYGTKEDVARKVVHELTKCVAENMARPKTTDAVAKVYATLLPKVTNSLCTDERSRIVRPDEKGEFALAPGGDVYVGKGLLYFAYMSKRPDALYPLYFDGTSDSALRACKKQLADAIGLIGGLNGSATYRKTATSATLDDANTCAWKGAAVCWSNPLSPTTFTCKGKGELALNSAQITIPTTPAGKKNTGECKGFGCFLEGLLKDKKIQKAVGQMFVRLFTNGGSACPRGMVQTGQTADGKAQCARAPEKPQPQCVMATNKTTVKAGEEVILKWKTANAKSVAITGIGEQVGTDGERRIYPATTVTYTLTAKGDGGEKTCQTTVTVLGGVSGSAGTHPPTLSCTPQQIEKETPVQIAWSCPAPADGSVGTNVATQGLVRGVATVSPSKSTEYRIACMQGDNEIGANTCTVAVGAPQYDIVTYPSTATAGEKVRISWGSLFMDRCRVQGPRGFDYSHTEGVVVTEPFAANATGTPTSAEYTLSCVTNYGTEVIKTAVVEYRP